MLIWTDGLGACKGQPGRGVKQQLVRLRVVLCLYNSECESAYLELVVADQRREKKVDKSRLREKAGLLCAGGEK